jgi:hypothetical protein
MSSATKTFHRGYYLSAAATSEPEGGWRARVAIISLDGDRTRSQRFLDFGVHDCAVAANAHAIASGKEWLDAQIRAEVVHGNTDVTPLR